MVYDIILGRDEAQKQKFGKEGTILLGKHYVKMGQTTSLSNPIYMDVSQSHAVFICGKRGSGKSYTMGVIAEGMAHLPEQIANRLAIVILDTMGIYWTMKYPNKQEEELLEEWGIKGKPLSPLIFAPVGYFSQFKEKGIPVDYPFSLQPSQLSAFDWCHAFGIDINSPLGVLIERVIGKLQDEGKNYSLLDIRAELSVEGKVEQAVRDAADNRFQVAEHWGLFSEEGIKIDRIVKGGQISILDVSAYAVVPGAENIRALVVGLLTQKLFIDRMVSRKAEEYQAIRKSREAIFEGEDEASTEPLVWIIIDEAHEFLPNKGKTAASDSLITILREGRQPGISLVLASQQPGKIHTDVMTQSDIVISHRITANVDIQALGMLMQSYMREGLDTQFNYLPRVVGSAIAFDDVNERMYPMRIRPRVSWHGGGAPTALREEKKNVFEF
ncbi:MAG TPA: ATP-binding protein [Candidatus Nanoarchaeia archaeon]|nr:ATP-binding protein [Candidatus Nanoarchaeia archaeon]